MLLLDTDHLDPGRDRPRTPASPHRPTASGWRELGRQALLVTAAALAYFAVRGATEGDLATARVNSARVLGLESRLGIDIESSIQPAVLEHHWLVTAANWIYIWGHWPVIVGTLVWLHRRHRGRFVVLRNAMFVSGAMGLFVFATFPVAPPRLAAVGLVDTVTEFSTSYRVLQPPVLVNEFAAVPSLHVGWNLLVGLVTFGTARRRLPRLLALLGPPLMATAVVVTANHFVFDAVAGSAFALVGLAVAELLACRVPGHIALGACRTRPGGGIAGATAG